MRRNPDYWIIFNILEDVEEMCAMQTAIAQMGMEMGRAWDRAMLKVMLR